MSAELMARNPVTNPAPAEVFKKAREHNITVMEARRVIIAANKVKAVKLERLLTLVDGLDDTGPDYAAIREAQQLAKALKGARVMTAVTIPTATRPITLEDARTEYGALTVTKHVYMHDFDLTVVQAFITEFSDVCPIALVTRTWVGGSHSAWKEEGQ